MFGGKIWNSIRWKIVFIYFLLVFIAMTIIGVFILNQLESYYMNSVRKDFTKVVADGILVSFNEYKNLNEHIPEIQTNIENWGKSFQEEIFIIDKDYKIIAVGSGNQAYIGESAVTFLDEGLITRGLNGETDEKDGVSGERDIPVKSMVFPIGEKGSVIGVLYLRADITSVYNALDSAKLIFLEAMLLALFVTVALGFLIARSITVPINDVTEKAEKMAQGDFSQEVLVKSNDEIGRLAEMFNLLREKLNFTLSEISNEKSKLETILKYMADGLIAVDLNGKIIHANSAAIAMLDITSDDLNEKDFDSIISRYSPALTIHEIKTNSKTMEGKESFEYGGSTFFARYARFNNENEENVGIIMIIQDITERQKLENMQKEFVANVSHELKTPLTTIKSYIETLLEGEVDDEETSNKFLRVVDEEADRMNRLVSDLLQLSRLDYNREKWNKRNNDIIPIIKNVVSKIEFTAKIKKQEIHMNFEEDIKIRVHSDKDKIEQVILNILSNAIKYTDIGGEIHIEAYKELKEAVIKITDNGIGIPEEEIKNVFERFYRVDKARSRAMGGTGLGLSIAKQITEEHKGRILLESHDGKGTTITIHLPLAGISL
jgi:two-component system, OmpR family, sensor histidine kinase VicK